MTTNSVTLSDDEDDQLTFALARRHKCMDTCSPAHIREVLDDDELRHGYPGEDWQLEVSNEGTLEGYWEWTQSQWEHRDEDR